LQVATAWNAARVAEQAVTTAGERLDAARRAFDVVRRRIEQGSATQLEYLDGQTALTAARLNETVTRYEAFARKIELDRVAALSPVPTSIERR
jgi:outer membrane protein TolC